jgi:hypothetical protein
MIMFGRNNKALRYSEGFVNNRAFELWDGTPDQQKFFKVQLKFFFGWYAH